MSETAQTINLEKRLEEVHVALMDSNFALATELLPEILEYGDEIQRQVAEAYVHQIEMLLEEANNTEEEIPEGLIAGDDEEEDAILGWDDEGDRVNNTRDISEQPEFDDSDNNSINIIAETNEVSEDTIISDEITIIQEASEVTHHATEHTTSDTHIPLADERSTYNSTSDEASVIPKQTENSGVLNEIASDENGETTIDPALEHEIDVALAQVAVLIADDELETAEFLIEKALTEGNPKQQRAAQQYQQIIEHTRLTHTDLSNETHIISVTDDGLGDNDEDKSFADDLFDTPEEDFEDWQAALDALDNDSDNIDNTYSDEDDTVASTYTEALDNYTNSNGEHVPDDVFNAWDDKSPSSHDTSDRLSPTDGAIASEATPSNDTIDDTGATVWQSIADSFENDNTEGLLAPSALLGGFDDNTLQNSQVMENPVIQQAMVNALPKSALSADINNTLSWSPSQALTAKQRQGFSIGGINLMVDFASGTELSKLPTYYRIPNSPTWLMGLTNMHGIVIPVFDLLSFLNVKSSNTKAKKMLLILEHEEKAVGIIIEGLPRRLVWHDTDNVANNTAPSALKEHIHAACLINDELWFDLNVSSLCAALESRMANIH